MWRLGSSTHPDDPPVPELGGIARLSYNVDGLRKAMEEVAPSPNHGLEMCVGCISEMGTDVIETLCYFDGSIIDDHVPRIIDDSDWNHRGHAHTTGYILALVDAVYKLG